MQYKVIKPEELSFNAFEKIGKEWMLISAYDEKKESGLPYNTMTASWGGIGVLWNKNVFFCFVRPQRYTKEFIDKSEYITLSFFDESMKKALSHCGRVSGRDRDKIKECGLTPIVENGNVFFEQAKMTIVGKKLFAEEMDEKSFVDRSVIASCYPDKDFHTTYICEIKEIRIAE